MEPLTLREAQSRLQFDDIESAKVVMDAAKRELGGVDALTRHALLAAMTTRETNQKIMRLLSRAPWPDGKPQLFR